MGPAQFQMADALAPDSLEEQWDTTLDETTHLQLHLLREFSWTHHLDGSS